MYYIIGADGRQYGPVTLDQLREWLAQNRVNAQTIARPETASEWRPLNTWPDLTALFPEPPAPTAATPGVPPPIPPTGYLPDPRASNKIPAGVCGILLGALGIHKFILGYTGPGLVMLLVTVLTCGIAYPVMWIIGLIEGVLYLAMSDYDFVRTHVEGRKPWF